MTSLPPKARPPQDDPIWDLMESALNETLTSDQEKQLLELLENNAALQELYRDYCELHMGIRFQLRMNAISESVLNKLPPKRNPTRRSSKKQAKQKSIQQKNPLTAKPPVVSVAQQYKTQQQHKPIANFERPLKKSRPAWIWGMSTALLVGCLFSWFAYQTLSSTIVVATVQDRFGMSQDEATVFSVGSEFSAEDQIDLTQGFLELRFQSGAVVVLQGPSKFQILSAKAGKLIQGKLVVTLPEDADSSQSQTEKFVVQTPGMRVTDLGTQFGVELKQDFTAVHVFQGRVRADCFPTDQITNSIKSHGITKGTAYQWNANSQQGEVFTADPTAFVKTLSEELPLPIFSTGVGITEGNVDPHWKVIEATGYPQFQAGAAYVVPVDPLYLPNVKQQSQWISLASRAITVPNNASYRFATQFDLTGFDVATCKISGRILADNQIGQVRLNGQVVSVPQDHAQDFTTFIPFTIEQGFQSGSNTLEVDVRNGPGVPGESRMSLRVEVSGIGKRLSTSTAQ